MPRPRLVVATLATALVLAACSGAEKTGPAASEGAGSTPTEPAPTAANRSTDPFCTSLRAYSERYGRVSAGASDPQQLRVAMQDGASAIAAADQSAPPEIKADVDVLDRAFQQLLAVLQATNFDFTKVSLAQVEQFQTTEFTNAGAHVDAYVREHC